MGTLLLKLYLLAFPILRPNVPIIFDNIGLILIIICCKLVENSIIKAIEQRLLSLESEMKMICKALWYVIRFIVIIYNPSSILEVQKCISHGILWAFLESIYISLSLSLNAGNTLLFYKVKTFIIYHYGGLLFGTSFF